MTIGRMATGKELLFKGADSGAESMVDEIHEWANESSRNQSRLSARGFFDYPVF